ncbi:MAG: hypothetical protein AAF253_13085 [Pseudomonadota bacterium]
MTETIQPGSPSAILRVMHPMDETRDPVTATLWSQLVALVDALCVLLMPSMSGTEPVLVWRRRTARAWLRVGEGLLRRLLLIPAAALAETLALGRAPRKPRLQRAEPSRETADTNRLFPRFSLHEAVPDARSDQTSTSARHRQRVPACWANPHGLNMEPVSEEFARLSTLALTVSNPEAVTLRLARIIARRQARAAAKAPASTPSAPAPLLPFLLRWARGSAGDINPAPGLAELIPRLSALLAAEPAAP